jgi:hypothetical protein|tara:strand:+ start:550 stop:858 length:309 start_codon:yes stop_codon:yes gene_type:complete
MTKININGIQRDMTVAEQAEYDAKQTAAANALPSKQLKEIKKIRLQKLQETDYLANSDMTMPSDVATWRQAMRDITDNYSESDYEDLLDHDGTNFTHEVWSK